MKINDLNVKISRIFTVVLMLTASLLFFTACGEDEPDLDDDPIPTDSVLEILAESSNHTQLNAFITANATLTGILSAESNITLFAPTDQAFDNLKTILGVPDLAAINPAVIAGVLAFHVHNQGVLRRADFNASTTIATVQTENILFNSAGNIRTGGSNEDVQFDGDEILATNGVVHSVQTILIPPTVFTTIGANLGKVSQTILLGAPFSTLASAIQKADTWAAETDGVTPLSHILAGAAGPDEITVFAPVNQVFEAAEITLDNFTAQEWYGLIANHVLGTKKLKADLVVGVGNPTLAGGAITLLPSGGLDSDGVPGAEATFVDGATDIQSDNGVVHTIAGILRPAAAGRYAIDEIYKK